MRSDQHSARRQRYHTSSGNRWLAAIVMAVSTRIVLLAAWVPWAASASAEEADASMAARLQMTRAANLPAVIGAQFGPREATAIAGFRLPDPYSEPAAETVAQWQRSPGTENAVCAVRFLDARRIEYELRTFPKAAAARSAGFTVTHRGRCGSCSTLRDLAVYLTVPDLTSPARRCARKWGARRIRACFASEIGFTPYCAESWTYNALHTRAECRGACVETYGLLNLLLHRYPVPNNGPDGRLNACLQCDEDNSGPGFRYSAGRTRRNSGIRSAIRRDEEELYPVDHAAYFAPSGDSE